MPSVNKQFLRQEFDQLKVKFDGLSNDGKISPEASALFQAMIMLAYSEASQPPIPTEAGR